MVNLHNTPGKMISSDLIRRDLYRMHYSSKDWIFGVRPFERSDDIGACKFDLGAQPLPVSTVLVSNGVLAQCVPTFRHHASFVLVHDLTRYVQLYCS